MSEIQKKVLEKFSTSLFENFYDLCRFVGIEDSDIATKEKLKTVLNALVAKKILMEDPMNPASYVKIEHAESLKEKEKSEEPKDVCVSFIEDGDVFYEQIWDGKLAEFVAWNGKYFIKIPFVVIDGIRIFPITDQEVSKGAILLPSYPEECTLDNLIKEIQEHISKYCDISEDFKIFSSYYVLLSWVYDRLTTIPYMRVLGDTGTGKSRYLDVVGRLCYKACKVSGALTTAPIYRLIEKWGCTIVLNEADFKDSDEKNDIVKILNCGFERNDPVIRCNPNDPSKLDFFPTFCPKIIATRFSWKDKALESRCLTEEMKQTRRKDIPKILPNSFYVSEASIRNKLLYFRMLWRNKIDSDLIQIVDLGDIEPRLWQGSASFGVLFANIPDLWAKFRAFIEQYQIKLIEERSGTFEGMIVNALADLLDEGSVKMTTKDIADRMGSLYEMEVEPRVLGRFIKSLGLRTHVLKDEGKTKRFLDLTDKQLIVTLRKRYIPNDVVTSVTSVTSHIGGLEKFINTDSTEKASELHEDGLPLYHVTDVTDVTDDTPLKQPPLKQTSHAHTRNTILLIIQYLERINKDLAIKSEVLGAFEDKYQEAVEKEIQQMIKENIIFEPRSGCLKVI